MTYESIALVDISYLWKLNWHGMPRDAAPGEAAQSTLNELAQIRDSVDHVIICCDSPPYLRAEKDPNYKATREPPGQDEMNQKRWLFERIVKDGYQVARSKGHEADDVIATLCVRLPDCPDIRIVANDKDMAVCVRSYVSMHVPAVGTRSACVRGREEIVDKYGVFPEHMPLWLALCGDSSDNVPGVPGIGAKKAAGLIQNHGDLNGIAEAMSAAVEVAKEAEKPVSAMWKSLAENWQQLHKSLELVTLVTDVPLDVEALLEKKEPERLVEETVEEEIQEQTEEEAPVESTFVPISEPGPTAPPTTALVRSSTGADWSMALQPRDNKGALALSSVLFNSRLYSKFPSEQAIFAVLMRGRELGLGVTTTLDNFHVIEGKPAASAHLIMALAQRDPNCEYLMLVKSTPTEAVYRTKHRAHPEPVEMGYTLDEAKAAGMVKGGGSPWAKFPKAMLRKTAGVLLVRSVYQGAVCGLYCPEEMGQ